MATTFLDISTYKVFAYGGTGNSGADAMVSLGIPKAFAFLRFYPEGTPLPANHTAIHQPSGNTMFYVSYRYVQLSNVVDLLRNETPVWFFFRDDTLASYITTSSEPIGEGE